MVEGGGMQGPQCCGQGEQGKMAATWGPWGTQTEASLAGQWVKSHPERLT